MIIYQLVLLPSLLFSLRFQLQLQTNFTVAVMMLMDWQKAGHLVVK